MSAPAATTTTAEAAAATTAATRLLGTGFVDDQVAAAKVLPVHGVDSAVGFFVIGNFDEGEAARLSGKPIANEIDCRGINACLGKIIVQGIFRCGERKIANIELL